VAVECELVEQARRGSRDAFEALVHGSVDRLYAIAYRILRDADAAEDAVQQALIEMWDDLPDLRDPERFEGWSYRLVVRAAYHEARRRPVGGRHVRRIALIDAVEDAATIGDPITRITSQDELERAFRELSPEHRAILVLRFYIGLPVSEIAAALQIPTGTAASRLHYALRDLRAACEAGDREPAVVRTWA
jgi:RNA polymerase sigma-70 factor, ECF subfamily